MPSPSLSRPHLARAMESEYVADARGTQRGAFAASRNC